MRLYIAVVESWRQKGRRVTLAVHARSKRQAMSLVGRRYTKWKVEHLAAIAGPKCIAFLDEFPE